MPESVEEKCYGCRGVTDEDGRPKFFGSQRDHDVCCMMTPEEQIDYISEDVIHKIITTPELREELFARVEVEIPNQEDRKIVKEILSRSKSNFPSERFLLYNLVHRNMSSSQTKKKRFTFDRRKLTIDPVPTIYYYTNINDATVKLNYDSNKNVVNNLIPLSVCEWIWNGCNFEINLKNGC